MKFALFISMLSGSVFAQHLTPSNILDSIRTHYAQLNDASALFTQSVKMRYKKNTRQQSGSVLIKKGNRYRIESDMQTIVTDGKTVWMYNTETKQVLIDQFKESKQPFSPDKFLIGLPKDFSASNVEKKDDHFILTLQPTKSNTSMSTIISLKVRTGENNWNIESIEMIDKNNTITTISLSEIHFNEGVDDAKFEFKITPEMNVVNLKSLQ